MTRTRPHGQVPAGWLAAAVVALGAAAVGAQVARDARYPREVVAESVLYVPSGAVLGRLALSYDALLADVYWIRALQHFGGTRLDPARPKDYPLLYPLLDIATTLDPRFTIAYRFGAIFLSESPPGGPGRPDLAVTLLEKGVAAKPDEWRYLQDIGFVHYWWLGDYPAAATWFERAARVEGAPFFLRPLAAAVLAEGGDRASSRALWTALRDSAEHAWLRENAAWRLMQLDALDAIDALTPIAARYVASGARLPYTWEAMVRAGYLRAVPRDPAGTPYYLSPFSGTVEVAADSPLSPMPGEQAPAGAPTRTAPPGSEPR
ncbi:MAG: hypothetical protein KJ061_14245 [Vicinamibacteraceae bacterium]|nr:hypothetical protein [Vicinamibacteraceae bacterium]